MSAEIWGLVHAERAALLADLGALTDDQWELPSLCADWTVHDVLAHLVNSARTTRLGFLWSLALSRFDFDRLNAAGVTRERARTPEETLRRFAAVADRTSSPPAPLATRLVEEIVHGADIRRPLGIRRDYPAQPLRWAIEAQARTSTSFGGAKEVLREVRIVATDADLRLGEGAEVRGSSLALLLALCGRHVVAEELDGAGVETLMAGGSIHS